MPAGRPTAYNEELQEKADWYVDNYDELGQHIPTMSGLAGHLKINRATVKAWSQEDDKPKFSSTVEILNTIQETELWNCGLDGRYKEGMSKFMLGNHGYQQKTQQENTGDTTINVNYVKADKPDADN